MKTIVKKLKDVDFKSPVLIEGLPGIGHVGKLVADHLVEELKAEKIIEIISPHFPPQVIVGGDGVARLVRNEIHAARVDDKEFLILVGDFQSTTSEGHYEIAELVLDIAHEYNVKMIYTLGGYGIGHIVEKEEVMGAVNDPSLIEPLKEAGVEFRPNEPGGGIVGISGLLLGLAVERGIPAACLMGVTPGYMIDPKGAKGVLKVLMRLLGIEVGTGKLDERAKEMEKIIAKLREMERAQLPPELSTRDEELRYIG